MAQFDEEQNIFQRFGRACERFIIAQSVFGFRWGLNEIGTFTFLAYSNFA
jgi:hypothetical protein